MRSYPPDRLRGEVAYIAYYLHWPYDQVMAMDHWERRHWVSEVSKINQRLNDAAKETGRWAASV
jgi:hypothetical protein